MFVMAAASAWEIFLDFLHQTEGSMLSNLHKAGTELLPCFHKEGTTDWPLRAPGN